MTVTDASFANDDSSSQIGYVIVLAGRLNNATILHWQSAKCRRMKGSAFDTEIFAPPP